MSNFWLESVNFMLFWTNIPSLFTSSRPNKPIPFVSPPKHVTKPFPPLLCFSCRLFRRLTTLQQLCAGVHNATTQRADQSCGAGLEQLKSTTMRQVVAVMGTTQSLGMSESIGGMHAGWRVIKAVEVPFHLLFFRPDAEVRTKQGRNSTWIGRGREGIPMSGFQIKASDQSTSTKQQQATASAP
jgi:hypothetical protein